MPEPQIQNEQAETPLERAARAEIEAERPDSWATPADPAAMAADGEDLAVVCAAQSEGEAMILRGVLESEGIPVAFDNLAAPAMGTVFQAGEDRWADLLVPQHMVGQAREILAAARANSEGGDA